MIPHHSHCAVVVVQHDVPHLAEFLESLSRHVPGSVLIIDGTVVQLANQAIEGLKIVRHETAQGRGASLAEGFALATAQGFTHAITIEPGGRHDPTDVRKLVHVSTRNPQSIVLGFRRLLDPGAHFVFRIFLRLHSNFWTWLASGRWVKDSLTGFRVYPLKPLENIVLESSGPEFETEALVKCIWHDMTTRAVPVRAGGIRKRRPLWARTAPSIRWSWMIAKLIGQRILFPRPLLKAVHGREFQSLRPLQRTRVYIRGIVLQETDAAAPFAWAVAVGVFFGILPIWGVQLGLAIALAKRLGLSLPLVILACNVSWGLSFPFIFIASLAIGQLLTEGEIAITLHASALSAELIKESFLQILLGGTLLAAACAVVFGIVAYIGGLLFFASEPDDQK